MSSNIRKSNTGTPASASNVLRAITKQIPIMALCASAGVALSSPAERGASAQTNGVGAASHMAFVPWTDHMREVIRRAHNRLHQRSVSLEGGQTLSEAIEYFVRDYLNFGFDPELNATELLAGQADTVELYCLLLAPEDGFDATTLLTLEALCPAMIVELGGSVEDLRCD